VYAGKDADGNPVYETPRRVPTIRDVTRHTAGFSRGDSPGDPIAEAYTADEPLRFTNTLAQMAEKLGRIPLGFHPGERWLYGDSVDVQAFLVERISGQPFADYLNEHVFAPLRMNETRYFFGPGYDHRRTVIYERQPDGGFAPEDPAPIAYNGEPRTLTPGGWGLISTLDDYMRFARMLLAGGALDGVRILQPETVRLMATNALPATLKDSGWLPSKGQMGFGIDFATRIASPATPDENSGEIGEFLGRPRVDLVLGRSGERHRRRALHADDALQHAAGAQGIPRRHLLERRHRRRTANGAPTLSGEHP
jgi:CubicO group peptidase (beta-lactamase class C family)